MTDDQARAFRVTAWGRLPNYECTACAFSTLDLSVMQEHAVKRHGFDAAEDGTVRRPRMREVKGLILGPDGKPITHIAIEE